MARGQLRIYLGPPRAWKTYAMLEERTAAAAAAPMS
jgi:K+-sensing histidine kinase KdpD